MGPSFQDFQRRLEGSVLRVERWLVRHADRVSINFDHDAASTWERRKRFSEVALYLLLCHRWGEDVRSHPLTVTVLDAVSSADYAALIRRSPERALLFSLPCALAVALGHEHLASIDAIRLVLSGPRAMGTERMPHRMLDYWFSCCSLAVKPPWTLVQLVTVSGLTHPPSPIGAGPHDGYALTHAVFYVTGFEPEIGCDLDVDIGVGVGRCLRLMALKFLDQRKTDLALECALASAIATSSIGEVERLVLSRCLEELERWGAVASDGDDRCDEVQRSQVLDEWDRCYHTMLVLGIAVRTALRLLAEAGRELPTPHEHALETIGAVASCLERYHLARAATGLASCEPRSELTRDLMSILVDELAAQENAPSVYGFMVDEEALYRLRGGDDFEGQVTAPLSELVAACLEQARRSVAGFDA